MGQQRRKRHLAEYLVFRTLTCIVDALPIRVAVCFAQGMAFFVHRMLPSRWSRRKMVAENICRALGEDLSDRQLDRIIHGMWVHLFRLVVEMVQMPRKFRRYNMRDIIQLRDTEQCVQAMSSGRPVIALSGHYGNWEVALMVFGAFGFPMGAIARDLDNPYLNDWFKATRGSTGHMLISKKGAREYVDRILGRGGFMAMLFDQDAGPRGIFVDFFGHPASTFKSIALMAMQHDAIIYVGCARRLPDDFRNNRWVRYDLGCEEMIDPRDFQTPDAVREISQRYTHALERAILRAPEQYFWLHRRWKTRPQDRRKNEPVSDAA